MQSSTMQKMRCLKCWHHCSNRVKAMESPNCMVVLGQCKGERGAILGPQIRAHLQSGQILNFIFPFLLFLPSLSVLKPWILRAFFQRNLSNVVWVFLIYMWIKKYVKISLNVFKMFKMLLEMDYQRDPKKRNIPFKFKINIK